MWVTQLWQQPQLGSFQSSTGVPWGVAAWLQRGQVMAATPAPNRGRAVVSHWRRGRERRDERGWDGMAILGTFNGEEIRNGALQTLCGISLDRSRCGAQGFRPVAPVPVSRPGRWFKASTGLSAPAP